MFTYLLLTSVCFQHKLSFGFPPNEAEDYDSSAFPLSPLTPLTSFTRGVFFPLTFQCTCRPFSRIRSFSWLDCQSFSHYHTFTDSYFLCSLLKHLPLSLSSSLCLFVSLSLSSPNKYVCLCFTRLVEPKNRVFYGKLRQRPRLQLVCDLV